MVEIGDILKANKTESSIPAIPQKSRMKQKHIDNIIGKQQLIRLIHNPSGGALRNPHQLDRNRNGAS